MMYIACVETTYIAVYTVCVVYKHLHILLDRRVYQSRFQPIHHLYTWRC